MPENRTVESARSAASAARMLRAARWAAPRHLLPVAEPRAQAEPVGGATVGREPGAPGSPSVRERLRRRVMLNAIVEAHALGLHTVVLTSGEATLRWRDLLECISYATSLGMRTRVRSNALWARSIERAGQRLDVLLEHGLAEIAYVTGDEHARFVPWERIVFAAAAAIDRGLPVHVTVELGRQRRITRAMLLEHPLLRERAERARRLLEITERSRASHEHGRIEPFATDVDDFEAQPLEADGRFDAVRALGVRFMPELGIAQAGGATGTGRAFAWGR